MKIILKFLKNNWLLILAVVITAGLFTYFGNNKISKLNSEIEELSNQYKFYQGLYEGQLSANNILKMSETDLKHSKDSLMSELGMYIEENRKLKKIKTPESVAGITQTIHDTIPVPVPVELPKFDVTKKFNEETVIRVQGSDSLLNIIPDISNTIKLEIGVNRVYKNSYKNWWVRFWHFDWKKVNSYEYVLDQSNELIKLKDVKIISIKE